MFRLTCRWGPAAGLLGAVFAAGCARVNPQPDYRRAAGYVGRSTGHARLFDPQQRAADAQLAQELLADGLTAEEAAQVALLSNPELQAALYEIGVARAELVQAGLLSNPSLGLALRLPSAGGLANIDFDLAQNLADLWQIPLRKKAAERNLEQTILTIARQGARTAARAKSAYWSAVGADHRLRIARENLEVSRKILDLTRFRREAGAGSELDVNLAHGVVLDARLAVTEARLAAASARRALATVLGFDGDAGALRLTETLPAPPDHAFEPRRLIDAAWTRRLDVRALQHAVGAAEQRLALEVRRVFPTLEVGVALERDARRRMAGRKLLADTARSSIAAGALSAPDIQPRSERRQAKGQDVIIGPMLSIELPVFDQNQARIAKAGYELEQRLRVLEGLRRTLRQEVREAVDQAQAAWDVARFYQREVVPQARKSLELSRAAYKAGRSSILSVLDAQRSFLAARDQYAAALQRAATAVPALERAVGLPLERVLEETKRSPGAAADATGAHP